MGDRCQTFGLFSPSESLPPPYRLQQVNVQVVENELCDHNYHVASRRFHDNSKIIQSDMLCAGSEGRDSCYVSCTPSPPLPGLALAAHMPCSVPLCFLRATLAALWSARRMAPGI